MPQHRKGWVAAGCTAIGGAHRRRGVGGDDAHLFYIGGRVCYLIAADGAGGAAHSAAGSHEAVFAAMDWLTHNQPTPSDPQGYTLMVRCFAAARLAIARRAKQLDVPIDELSTTLTVAIVNEGGVLAGQVGDGALVIETGDGVRAALWDAKPGAANKADFVTDDDYLEQLRSVRLRERVTGAVLVTDGVEGLTISRKGETREGFYRTLLQIVRGRPEWGGAVGLDRVLESPTIRERCDDDLTIVAVALTEETHHVRKPVRRKRLRSGSAQPVPDAPGRPRDHTPRPKDGGRGRGRRVSPGRKVPGEDTPATDRQVDPEGDLGGE